MSPPEPPGRGMLFAERQLRRHGWERGQGLGKRQDGIAEAIRVKVKCDTAGVGHDAAEPFSFHWWDHVFNRAAANIAVEAGQDGISVKTLSQQSDPLSTKKPRRAGSAGPTLYGRFVKSATLTAHGEEPTTLPTGSESSEEEEKLDLSSARRLTDEELVRVCGGRTAHKGARHGLTMSAKLARLEEQERVFLAARQREPPESSPHTERQGKKKKRKRSRDGADPEGLQSQEPSGAEEVEGEREERKILKRRKKKKKQEPSGAEEVEGEREERKIQKRKKKKKQELSREEEVAEDEGKVLKRKNKNQELSGAEEVEGEEGKVVKRKKKKKKKEEDDDKEELAEAEVPLEGTDEPDWAGHSPRKKKKKKRRRRRETE